MSYAAGCSCLEGFDRADDSGLNFDVIAYRGAPVFSKAAWMADAKARGGVVGVRVPGGFFQDIPAARFGTAPPYVYELPPIWLLVLEGVDVAADDFLRWADYQGVAEAADNQRQDVVDIVKGAAGAGAGVVGAIPDVLKWGAILAGGLVGLELLRAIAPRRSG